MHSRREPSRNTFRYRVSYFLLDLDELPQIERRLTLVSHNRRNVVSFRDRDYLDGDGTPLKEAVVRFCAERGAVVERVAESRHLVFEGVGQVKLKGFDEPVQLCRAASPAPG